MKYKGDKHLIMDDGLSCFIIIVLVVFSAFFSASETAFTSCNKIKLKTQADDGDKKAQAVLNTIEKYDRLLSTILIGNNIVNIASASIATVVFVKHFGDLGSTLSTVIMTIIVLIFGEVLPKNLAKNHAEAMAKFFHPIIKLLIYIFIPFSWLLGKLANLVSKLFKAKREDSDSLDEDDLLTIIDEIEEEGKIKPYEKDLISSAIKFDDIEVKDIVTPRKDVVAVNTEMTVDEVRQIFEESKYTRIPVYEDTIDNIIGILHEKDFYSFLIRNEEDFKIKKIMQQATFVSQETKISIVFKMFKDKRVHMAIVLDQFDSTLGIITLEDIIEELVGEIFDETDEIFEEVRQIEEGVYLVSGKELVNDAFDIIGIEIEDEIEDFDLNQTINSWLSKEFGKLPTSGDNFLFLEQWKVTVKSASKKGAKEVEIMKVEK